MAPREKPQFEEHQGDLVPHHHERGDVEEDVCQGVAVVGVLHYRNEGDGASIHISHVLEVELHLDHSQSTGVVKLPT